MNACKKEFPTLRNFVSSLCHFVKQPVVLQHRKSTEYRKALLKQ